MKKRSKPGAKCKYKNTDTNKYTKWWKSKYNRNMIKTSKYFWAKWQYEKRVKRFNYYDKRAEKFDKALQNLLCPNPLLVVATNTQFYCHGGECTAIANTYFPTKKNCVKNSKMPLPDATFLRSLSLYRKNNTITDGGVAPQCSFA